MPDGFDAALIAPPVRRSDAEAAIEMAGGRMVAACDWSDPARFIATIGKVPLLSVEAESVAAAVLDVALPVLGEAIRTTGVRAVVTFDVEQLEPVFAALMMHGVELLCGPTLAEQVAALATHGRLADRGGLSDRVREDEAKRERRIRAQIGRVAGAIVGGAERDRGRGGGGVGDRHVSFGFAPALESPVDAQTVRQAIRSRRMRDSFFGDGLFEDPAWDILLDLYAAHLERQRVSVSSLCIAAAVAPTTALRWIARMTEAGLLDRWPDPDDGRRAFITLSRRALEGMEGYAAALDRAGLPFA
ncbi:hypothetical protein GCM10011380_14320 [Sphingomonas metalli]|uniref:MarR family transcriptional regulator n=1 Tax=Sphingomonas metalli TaxID=1779358 RepID=A0A916WQV1_9SPHN|nr:winged helix DNA-binding protein [Sphingomonas metalli]GGB25861.1 hypothetical protein GCM10011380_14320 [Sphingomonas metalli]